METVADLLEKAADALESGRIQWGKYGIDLHKPPGTMCAAETIVQVGREMGMEHVDLYHPSIVVDQAQGLVSLHVTKGRDRQHLTAWNDTQARTLDEVIQAFKETAKDIRNQAQTPEQVIL